MEPFCRDFKTLGGRFAKGTLTVSKRQVLLRQSSGRWNTAYRVDRAGRPIDRRQTGRRWRLASLFRQVLSWPDVWTGIARLIQDGNLSITTG